jgi:hypothetical protein
MKDKELDAVRLALQRIQRIASEPMDETDAPGGGPAGAGRAGIASRFSDTAMRLIQKLPLPLPAAIFAVTVIAVGAAGLASWGLMDTGAQLADAGAAQSAPPPPAREPQALSAEPLTFAKVPSSGLEIDAQGLLEAGRIREVRLSLAGVPQKSPELALILARSYDPNYLRHIPNVDAGADVAEAERWYRTWRDIASEQGLVMEPERFDRIIKAMR